MEPPPGAVPAVRGDEETTIRRDPNALLKLFELRKSQGRYVTVCAPMVRYSKLAFRELVRGYAVDVAYTPMVLASVFVASQYARDAEFITLPTDSPVVLQLAAKNADEFATAAMLAAPFIDGVDVNCGCPQRWAIKERIGSYLMQRPDLIADMMSTVRRRAPELTRTVKIRVHANVRETVELARQAEAAGAQLITVHGRTRAMRSSNTSSDPHAIAIVKQSVQVPVVANGDVFTLADADTLAATTGADGIMAARGLLVNPALFAGYDKTPIAAARRYLGLAVRSGTHPFVLHHHIAYMLESHLAMYERRRLQMCTSVAALTEWMDDVLGEEEDGE